MTRTDYTNALRRAGFSVQPTWQGRSDHCEIGRDITCYTVCLDGQHITDVVVKEFIGHDAPGLDVFFVRRNLTISEDIAQLLSLANAQATA